MNGEGMRFLPGLLMLGVAAAAFPQASQQPFTLALSAVKPQVIAGAPVEIRITMTNTSDRQIDCPGWWSNGVDRAYEYRVLDQNGQAAPRIVRKHPEIGEEIRPAPCVVKPGKTSKPSGAMVGRLFDFSHPGEYTIQVSRHVSPGPKSEAVKSNTITITVLPANNPP
ncbi:MAG: hypothetical protein WAM66_05725 [Acidobacteriaceae bacterium]